MDPKKQELNPELKEIYDRVMNTQIKNPQNTTESTAVSAGAPQPGSFAGPQTVPGLADAQSAPPASPSLGGPNPSVPPPPTSSNEGQDPFLSSDAPRPVTDTKSFVFTGNKVTTPQEPHVANQPQTHPSSSKKISGPIIVTLVVILIVVWALFWAKFFGLI